ncbi:MAG TPA: response regulator [Verrucomicrobiae bacterium]|nr:response regulator [Verrucomicrobiae bacterium]
MRYGSIRWRTTALIIGGGLVSAMLTAAGVAGFAVHRFWMGTRQQVSLSASLASYRVAPALANGDRIAATQMLAALRAEHLVSDAWIYDDAGACFAAFHRSSNEGCRPQSRDTLRSGTSGLTLSLPVPPNGPRQGTLLLAVGPPATAVALDIYRAFLPWIVALGLAVAAITAALAYRDVSTPILAIANIAQRIAQTHSFEKRVTVKAHDELAVLAGSLNSMLDEIARRDAERAEDRRQLELQIAECSRVNKELLFAIDKAEEASRLKGEFLANMSHEIRTPMNGILGFTQLCLSTQLTEDQRDYLDTVERSAESLMQLLNDILDVSKIEAGRMELDRAPFSMRDCVESSTRTMFAAAQQKGLQLACEVDPQIPDNLIGDENRIRQVLLNLLGNAIKFTDRGSVRVAVAMEPAADSGLVAHFTVRDTGPGIPEDKRKIIFEPFRQADGSTTRRYGGTGLGLAISSGLVDILGGRIWLESQVGIGSTFHFTAPFALGATVIPQRAAAPANSVECAPLSILVAEDNIVSQRLVKALLQERGHAVTLAGNGVEVLHLLEQRDFDLILMDIQMPEMDGLQATAEIRHREGHKGKHLPIVAMTAHAMAGDRERCLDAGMDGYIAKPIHPAELMALITGITAQRVAAVAVLGAA